MTGNGEQRAIADRYAIVARIGSGGMGTVWRATDQLLGRTVAIKEIPLHTTGAELSNRMRRAMREARAVARISHPHVVDVYDLVQHEGRLWIVMELVKGPSLAEYLASNGPLTPAQAAAVGLQLVAALDAVHAVGALHRDVKPANVLLRPDGNVVLCDFGIAVLTDSDTDSLTGPGEVVGSLPFLAPERLIDQPVGPPSDLFSLGCTLCALVSGRSPFERSEAAAILHAVAHGQPEIPRSVGPLRPLIEALLRKDPAARPLTPTVLAHLRAVAGDAPQRPATVRDAVFPSLRPTPAPARRRPRRWAIPVVGALVAGAVVTAVLVSRSPDGSSAAAGATTPSGGASRPAAPPAANGRLTPVDAVMPVPGELGHAAPSTYWLFSANQYTRVDVAASGTPFRKRHTTSATSLSGWSNTFQRAPGFTERIDATLRVPGQRNQYWVFSGDQYMRIRVGASHPHADTLLAGPRSLGDWTEAFAGRPGFLDGIDAVMPTPDMPNEVWVFAGSEYVRVRLHDGTQPGGVVAQGPSKLSAWSDTFDDFPDFKRGLRAVLPVPNEPNQFWAFSARRAMRIEVADGDYADAVLEPPRPLQHWDDIGDGGDSGASQE
ncbi:protein kinase [Streptomyces buecherae]|uniref:protein kinase domain-containing protein n=1 Tax=Streptomyces buecherae TaxID=2763006 RepID=UPI0033E1A658